MVHNVHNLTRFLFFKLTRVHNVHNLTRFLFYNPISVHNVHNVHNTRDKHALGKLLTITVHNVHNLLFS